MKKIISFSGGKDSTALLLWAKENLQEFDTVFCDTGWEHPLTYEYIEFINKTVLGGNLIYLRSKKYQGFADMSMKKKRVASTKARFCTEELKLKPVQDFIQPYLPEVELYVGVRADESVSRSKLPERAYADMYKCEVVRPLLRWSAEDCFAIMRKHKIEPNPLYKMGMKRVGCMPCIMTAHGEMANIIKRFPEVVEKIKDLEDSIGTTFFPPGYIPAWKCSRMVMVKKPVYGYKNEPPIFDLDTIAYMEDDNVELKGHRYVPVKVPCVQDVVDYLRDNPDQIEMEEEGPTCMSYYSICE